MSGPEVVRSESLPERKESFVSGDLADDVEGATIFGFSVDNLHVLNSGIIKMAINETYSEIG